MTQQQNVLRVDENGRVSVPVVTLARRRRQVVLFGMSHIATPDFFSAVLSRLETYEKNGHRVLHEYMDPAVIARDSRAQQLHKRLEFKDKKLRKSLRRFGLAYQSDIIKPRDTWLPADMDSKRFFKSVPWIMPTRVKSCDHLIGHPNILVKSIIRLYSNQDGVPLSSLDVSVIRDERDGVAVTNIVATAQHANVATFWGAAHIPGITTALIQEHGFSVVEEEWFEFLDLVKLTRKIR